jgi:uncharacterized protein (TIGR02421 family)
MTEQEKNTVRELSNRIVKVQSPILVLDSIKWDAAVRDDFLKHKGRKLPAVDQAYYDRYPLRFSPEETIEELEGIIKDINNQMDRFSHLTEMMVRACQEYIQAVRLLQARGTPRFSQMAMDLYGSPKDAFYPGGPRLCDLAYLLNDILQALSRELVIQTDQKQYSAEEAVILLRQRLGHYFSDTESFSVELSDQIVADAAAGSCKIKLNQDSRFSERDLRYLEVHEGWVHVGTSLNGRVQSVCTFLSKGPPNVSVTQEGLAILMEILNFSSSLSSFLNISIEYVLLILHSSRISISFSILSNNV